MDSKKKTEKNLEYARGYRDALVDTWETVIKLATKGFSSRELQIMSKSNAMEAIEQIDVKIAQLEAELAQNEIIDTDDPIDPMPEVIPVISVNVKPGMSYMVKEQKPARCYKMFEKEIATGKTGLCVSRTSPTVIRDNYRIGKTQVIWLTSSERMDTNLPPSALGVMTDDRDAAGANDEYVQPNGNGLSFLYSYMLNFLDGNHGGIIVFEGLEYLISHNNFPSVLKFFQKINEDFKSTNSIFIVSVNPSAFDSKQLSQLENEMNQVLNG